MSYLLSIVASIMLAWALDLTSRDAPRGRWSLIVVVSIALPMITFVIAFLGFTCYCAIRNGQTGHYVCGL
jgi:hypothetical protein